MNEKERKSSLFRMLPGTDNILELLKDDPSLEDIPKSVITNSIRNITQKLRDSIKNDAERIGEKDLSNSVVIKKVKDELKRANTTNLNRLINASGVVVHTNLGRSLLTRDAVQHVLDVSTRYSNLEFDLATGVRGSRYENIDGILCEITGAQAAMVVNNNAGAVLLCLETIAKGKDVIVSRGELVEIGGSFRIPDVMARSGAILKEVGTTNRTHSCDYEKAIENGTGLLLKVHTSNYSVEGFTSSVSLKELVALGAKHNIPVMDDLGSGTFIDFSRYGILKEPTVQESVATGADVITFSGDKLLGGPQAGIIVGKKDIIDRIKQNPVTRALRIDKLTLAALESTIRLYRDEEKAIHNIPTLRMLTMPLNHIDKKAKLVCEKLNAIGNSRLHVKLLDLCSRPGGGAYPLLTLPSKCVGVKIEALSANAIEKYMREYRPPLIGRIEDDFFIMDMRTVQDDELPIIENAFDEMLNNDQRKGMETI
jgi:L-seryl-tRNA(Ser) seleniumtransferase